MKKLNKLIKKYDNIIVCSDIEIVPIDLDESSVAYIVNTINGIEYTRKEFYNNYNIDNISKYVETENLDGTPSLIIVFN